MTASSAKSSALDSLVEKLNTKASSLPKEQRDRAETALEEAADKARAAKSALLADNLAKEPDPFF
jgi:hypothetical protein